MPRADAPAAAAGGTPVAPSSSWTRPRVWLSHRPSCFPQPISQHICPKGVTGGTRSVPDLQGSAAIRARTPRLSHPGQGLYRHPPQVQHKHPVGRRAPGERRAALCCSARALSLKSPLWGLSAQGRGPGAHTAWTTRQRNCSVRRNGRERTGWGRLVVRASSKRRPRSFPGHLSIQGTPRRTLLTFHLSVLPLHRKSRGHRAQWAPKQ